MSSNIDFLWRACCGGGAFVFFILGLCAGCGGGDARKYDVSGTVSYGGEPVPTGAIVFEPAASQEKPGPPGFAPIEAGKFDTRNGKGVVGGPYVVKISGNDGKEDELGLFPSGQPLFAEHVIQIELPKEDSEQVFEVPRK